ncbi:MAG: M28 family peptidase [Ureaplasma sp.]|nr:M28 family peptidase [Ureaplasma sp.]
MKSKFFGGLALASLGAISLVTSTVLSSCQTQQQSYSVNKQAINQEVAQTFNDFLMQNHGRWTGNISKYGIDNLKTLEYTDKNNVTKTTYIGVNNDAKPLYDLQTKIDINVNNYGSYHSYLYILNKLTSMGLVNNSEVNINYPAQANVTFDSNTKQFNVDLSNDTLYAQKEDTSNPGTMIDDTNIIISSTGSNEDILKDGIVVQPFLWNGNDKANGILNTYNNEGQNIIATIAPNDTAKNDFYIVAHYDSTASGKNKASWGATDNATGVAVALEIINYIKDHKDQLGQTRLHVIFSDAEEVGVYGTKAFVSQYLLNNGPLSSTSTNNIGMINMDTVAGGDYIYAHSPNTSPDLGYNGTGNTSTTIRDQLNALSRIRSENYNDTNLELIIHPQVDKTEYRAGETGDWSDHMPFYKYANIPVTYMESTNFQVRSNSGKYDGYSQTTNLNAYILNDGTTLAEKNEKLKSTNINNSDLVVYDLPNYVDMSTYDDYEVTGNIWHYDIDTLDWVQKNIGDPLYQQLTTMFESLKLFLQTSIN